MIVAARPRRRALKSAKANTSELRGLYRNPTFLFISGLTLAIQVLIVTFGGRVFQVEPLDFPDWLAIVAATSSVVAFSETVRRFRIARAA